LPPTSPTPLRVRTLAPLLTRENVLGILGLSNVQSIKVSVKFRDGSADSKIIALAENGSIAMLLLDDNPDSVPGGAFFDIRPA
jgi:hypothetical protein